MIYSTTRRGVVQSLCSFRSMVSTTAAKEETSSLLPKHPTTQQLRIVALRYAIPMIGFGFMDNLVMIQAGDAIDQTFGVALGISTMTAAGFGQCSVTERRNGRCSCCKTKPPSSWPV